MSHQLEIQFIAVVVAVACALPGVFLVLRRMAMLSDAISHTILLGIILPYVLGIFLKHSLDWPFLTTYLGHPGESPILLVTAAAVGVLTVSLVELLNRSGRLHEDAAIGLVFPLLFSVAILGVSLFARNVHLDTDAVLLGDLGMAPFRRWGLGGYDFGPVSLSVMGAILALNALFLGLFYKELKLATFDPALAAALGFAPGLLHYGLMTLVSVTAVGAFDAVGSPLTVALMIAPPATAYLFAQGLAPLLALSALVGAANALTGYWLARHLDANIAGAMATTSGVLFGLALLFAPEQGLVAGALRRLRQRHEFAQAMLTIHLFNHEGLPEAERESRLDELHDHLQWSPTVVARVVRRAEQAGLVTRGAGRLYLTDPGRELARQVLVH